MYGRYHKCKGSTRYSYTILYTSSYRICHCPHKVLKLKLVVTVSVNLVRTFISQSTSPKRKHFIFMQKQYVSLLLWDLRSQTTKLIFNDKNAIHHSHYLLFVWLILWSVHMIMHMRITDDLWQIDTPASREL